MKYDLMKAPILYVNIAWMKRYKGHTEDDPVHIGNFAWFRRSGNTDAGAHEQFNFLPYRGRVVGYVPGSPNPALHNLGAVRDASKIEGVLVIFMARDPLGGKTTVVGCYHNAIVSHQPMFHRKRGAIEIWSHISAMAEDAVLVPVAARTERIPSWRQARQLGDSGGYGQSALWYGKSDVNKRVRNFLQGTWSERPSVQDPLPRTQSRAPRQPDIKTRLAVERAAMNAAIQYFDIPPEGDVSKKCCGWDLEVIFSGKLTRIEVKGLSGSAVSFELTPNELEKMEKYHDSYVLFILLNALEKRPVPMIFRYAGSSSGKPVLLWKNDSGLTLKIKKKIGAVCSL